MQRCICSGRIHNSNVGCPTCLDVAALCKTISLVFYILEWDASRLCRILKGALTEKRLRDTVLDHVVSTSA